MDGRMNELSQLILQYVFMIKFTLKQICLLINIKNIYNIQIIAIDLEIIYLLFKLFLHKWMNGWMDEVQGSERSAVQQNNATKVKRKVLQDSS